MAKKSKNDAVNISKSYVCPAFGVNVLLSSCFIGHFNYLYFILFFFLLVHLIGCIYTSLISHYSTVLYTCAVQYIIVQSERHGVWKCIAYFKFIHCLCWWKCIHQLWILVSSNLQCNVSTLRRGRLPASTSVTNPRLYCKLNSPPHFPCNPAPE